MSLLSRSIDKVRRDGVSSFLSAATRHSRHKGYQLGRVASTYANTKTTIGAHVLDRDWDVLVLLDTCRVDAMAEVADEYEWLGDIDSIRSVGGSSPEWISKTFTQSRRDTIRDTAYVTANTYSRWILDETTERPGGYKNRQQALLGRLPTVTDRAFGACEYLNEKEPRGTEGPLGHTDGHTPPRYVTDRGVQLGREGSYDRLVLHYWQPHYPYAARALREDRDLHRHEGMAGEWVEHIRETGEREAVWEAYLDELRYVLEDVATLRENVDAEKMIISSDHGEAFGEFGVYGHQSGSLHPHVRNVPWVTADAEDTGSYVPETDAPEARQSNESVRDQLEALGYRE